MKITPLLFLDAAAILVALIFILLLKDSQMDVPVGIIAYAIGLFIVVRLLVAGLVRVANSSLSDVLKFGWALFIVLIPILGSISCLIVIDRRRVWPNNRAIDAHD
jgi:hypothetical protein